MLLNEVMLAVDALVPPFATGSTPVMPVVSGNPVAFVSVTADGVPRFGVVSTGDVENTSEPAVPVSFVTAAARLAELGVARNVAMPAARPLTPVLIGRPVPFVSVTA